MTLLRYTPAFDVEAAKAIAYDFFGLRATSRKLPSERDQNFLLTDRANEKFVLKISNALESRAFLEAQNSVLKHLAGRVSFCQSPLPAKSGEEISTITTKNGETNFVRLVGYLPGVLMANLKPQPIQLLRDLGRKLGQLSQALADFDHPAAHRNFHWDLANGNRTIDCFGKLIKDSSLRDLVMSCRFESQSGLRRSVIHGDANDYNVLADPERMTVTGLLDFGDMVYSYTVGDLAIALAYVVLDSPDPLGVASIVAEGYTEEFKLVPEERNALWRLVLLRLAMSVCIAAYQQQQCPENEYLRISQNSIEKNLSRLILVTDLRG